MHRTENTTITLTDASRELFIALAEDSGNWSGTPLVEVDEAGKGNLTDLKRKGLLITGEDEGCTFAYFTQAGSDLAAELGIDGVEVTA